MEQFLEVLCAKAIEYEYFDEYMSTGEGWAFYLKRDIKDWDYWHDENRTYEKLHETIKLLDSMGHYKMYNIKGFCKAFAEKGTILKTKWEKFEVCEIHEVAEFLITAFGCAASPMDFFDV